MADKDNNEVEVSTDIITTMANEESSSKLERTEKTEKTKKKPKREKKIRTWSSTKILDCVAYFAVMFIAIALILKLIFKNNIPSVANAFQAIGECLAYIICIWLGLYWTLRKHGEGWNKRNIWWLICWIVATVVIVVIYVFAY